MYTLACGAVAGCHCWVPLLGMGGVGVQVGGLDVVTLLGAVTGCHCWAAIAGCHCWVPLLAAIAGDRWVYTLADWTWCRCWLPLAGCHCWAGGMWSGAMVRCYCWVPCGKVPLLGAIAGCNRE